jgi:hypothetical protein
LLIDAGKFAEARDLWRRGRPGLIANARQSQARFRLATAAPGISVLRYRVPTDCVSGKQLESTGLLRRFVVLPKQDVFAPLANSNWGFARRPARWAPGQSRRRTRARAGLGRWEYGFHSGGRALPDNARLSSAHRPSAGRRIHRDPSRFAGREAT